jgi:hypothetical protein
MYVQSVVHIISFYKDLIITIHSYDSQYAHIHVDMSQKLHYLLSKLLLLIWHLLSIRWLWVKLVPNLPANSVRTLGSGTVQIERTSTTNSRKHINKEWLNSCSNSYAEDLTKILSNK